LALSPRTKATVAVDRRFVGIMLEKQSNPIKELDDVEADLARALTAYEIVYIQLGMKAGAYVLLTTICRSFVWALNSYLGEMNICRYSP
jgi:hypothetical protein